jgi:hypothetical protein
MEDCFCERPACQLKIAKGAACFYVATIEPGKPGCHVCGPCYTHYQTKAATSVRPVRTAGILSLTSWHMTTDQHFLQQSVLNPIQHQTTFRDHNAPILSLTREQSARQLMQHRGSVHPIQYYYYHCTLELIDYSYM